MNASEPSPPGQTMSPPQITVTAAGGSGMARWHAVLVRSRLAQFLLLLALALVMRGATFGEWNFDTDEQFYALVGRRMLAGATLYVDIWDRKPPALYLVYAAIAFVSNSVLAFQLAATISAVLGAYGVARIAQQFAGAVPSLMGAAAYLAMLGRFGGATGQAPVWYTTLMIFAAWTIVERMDRLRRGNIDGMIVAAMTAAGVAVTFKQTAAIECAFFGLVIAANLLLSGARPRRVLAQTALLAVVALLPIAATFAWYWHGGHLPELWQALVRSNFTRLYVSPEERIWRFAVLLGLLGLPIVFAVWSWFALDRAERRDARLIFIAAWAIVALAAVAVFPNIYYHYAIPILPPLCVLSAIFFDRWSVGRIGFAALMVLSLFYGNTLNLATRVRAHQTAAELADYVRAETPTKRLLVWGNPNYLYVLTEATPPSRLAFPPHLYDGAERGVSGIDEVAELRHILARRPETVVAQDPIPAWPVNGVNVTQLDAYLKACAKRKSFVLYDHLGAQNQDVYSRCGGRD